MARYLTRDDGIREYYDDFCDSYQYFKCPKCGAGDRELLNLIHNDGCQLVIDNNLRFIAAKKLERLKIKALKKLTKKERMALGY